MRKYTLHLAFGVLLFLLFLIPAEASFRARERENTEKWRSLVKEQLVADFGDYLLYQDPTTPEPKLLQIEAYKVYPQRLFQEEE